MNLHTAGCASAMPDAAECRRIELIAQAHRQADPDFARWAAGYGVAVVSPLLFWVAGKVIRLASGCPLASTAECYTPAANAAAAEGLSLLCLFSVAPMALLALAIDHLAWRRWGA